jgi:hypothetical protein
MLVYNKHLLLNMHCMNIKVINAQHTSWESCTLTRVSVYCYSVECLFWSSVCYCIFMSYCISCILGGGGGCTSVNSAELAQISFAEAASLVRPCVMISLRMNLLWIHFVYGVLPLHFRRKLCFKRHNMDCHFTYLTAKYIRDKLSIFLTGFSSY